MRILLVHNRYRPEAPSGENAVVDQEARALTDLGHQVNLFERHSGAISEWSALRRATLPAAVLWSESSRRGMVHALRSERPDVVHVHNTFPLVTPSVLYACRSARVPVVATFHNYRQVCANGSLFRQGRVCHDCLGGSFRPGLIRGCYRDSHPATIPVVLSSWLHAPAWRRLVSAYILISAAQRDLLESAGLPPERQFVRHNFIPSMPRVQSRTEHVATFCGRLDVVKGIPQLMQAWDLFRQRRPRSGLCLQIVGGGELEEAVRQWAERHDSVRVLGHRSRAEAVRALAGSRVAVVPSAWEETFGLVAAEAMSMGTAALAPDHGAFPELIVDGLHGGLFVAGNPESLATSLADVDDHPQDWDARGRRAAKAHEDRFGPRAGMERLLEIYRFAIDNPVVPRTVDEIEPESHRLPDAATQ